MGGKSLILLDTDRLIWMDQADTRMGRSARALADAAIEASELAVSVISFWEVALLESKGRLRARAAVSHWRHEMLEHGVVELPLGGETCIAAARGRIFMPTRRIASSSQPHNDRCEPCHGRSANSESGGASSSGMTAGL